MNKNIVTALIILSCIVSLSCTSLKKDSEVKNTSYISEENAENKTTVTGILKQGVSCFYISQNPDSKSAVTIILTGTEGHEQTLNPLLDTEVTIIGTLISENSPWKKEVEFISVK